LHFNKDIILCEENKIINNQNEVAETFNNFFINVAKDIGSQDIIIDKSHPGIKVIEENKTEIKELCFNAVDSDFVTKYIMLKVSATSFWLFIILFSSHNIISLLKCKPLLVRNGLIVGQKFLLFGPPTHLSMK
jgi:hypothetical protein